MAESAFEELSRRLAVLVAKLDRTYDELLEANRAQREFNQEQRESNRQQMEFNADVRTTLARLDTLIARMLPHSENGREA